jgi:hypothetical protein
MTEPSPFPPCNLWASQVFPQQPHRSEIHQHSEGYQTTISISTLLIWLTEQDVAPQINFKTKDARKFMVIVNKIFERW